MSSPDSEIHAMENTARIAAALSEVTSKITAGIMSELSDIKTALAVNIEQTKNIRQTIEDIKRDAREQYEKLEPRITRLERISYAGAGALGVVNLLLWIFKH